eukprot:4631846-Lingulodinium_polyedra.AAC.1
MPAARWRRASNAATTSPPGLNGPRSAMPLNTAANGCGGAWPATASVASRNSTSASSSCSSSLAASAWACWRRLLASS